MEVLDFVGPISQDNVLLGVVLYLRDLFVVLILQHVFLELN